MFQVLVNDTDGFDILAQARLFGNQRAHAAHNQPDFYSGVAGGMSGFLGLTLVPYLLALRLSKEQFVATIAMLYLSGVLALYATLWAADVFTGELFVASALASIPTLLGLWVGSLLRRRVPEARFRKVLVVVLLLIAANLLRQSLFS